VVSIYAESVFRIRIALRQAFTARRDFRPIRARALPTRGG